MRPTIPSCILLLREQQFHAENENTQGCGPAVQSDRHG